MINKTDDRMVILTAKNIRTNLDIMRQPEWFTLQAFEKASMLKQDKAVSTFNGLFAAGLIDTQKNKLGLLARIIDCTDKDLRMKTILDNRAKLNAEIAEGNEIITTLGKEPKTPEVAQAIKEITQLRQVREAILQMNIEYETFLRTV